MDTYKEFLQDVLITIHMNLKDLRERKNFADPEEQSYIEGKLTAYDEVLGILRDSAEQFGVERKKIGF